MRNGYAMNPSTNEMAQQNSPLSIIPRSSIDAKAKGQSALLPFSLRSCLEASAGHKQTPSSTTKASRKQSATATAQWNMLSQVHHDQRVPRAESVLPPLGCWEVGVDNKSALEVNLSKPKRTSGPQPFRLTLGSVDSATENTCNTPKDVKAPQPPARTRTVSDSRTDGRSSVTANVPPSGSTPLGTHRSQSTDKGRILPKFPQKMHPVSIPDASSISMSHLSTSEYEGTVTTGSAQPPGMTCSTEPSCDPFMRYGDRHIYASVIDGTTRCTNTTDGLTAEGGDSPVSSGAPSPYGATYNMSNTPFDRRHVAPPKGERTPTGRSARARPTPISNGARFEFRSSSNQGSPIATTHLVPHPPSSITSRSQQAPPTITLQKPVSGQEPRSAFSPHPRSTDNTQNRSVVTNISNPSEQWTASDSDSLYHDSEVLLSADVDVMNREDAKMHQQWGRGTHLLPEYSEDGYGVGSRSSGLHSSADAAAIEAVERNLQGTSSESYRRRSESTHGPKEKKLYPVNFDMLGCNVTRDSTMHTPLRPPTNLVLLPTPTGDNTTIHSNDAISRYSQIQYSRNGAVSADGKTICSSHVGAQRNTSLNSGSVTDMDSTWGSSGRTDNDDSLDSNTAVDRPVPPSTAQTSSWTGRRFVVQGSNGPTQQQQQQHQHQHQQPRMQTSLDDEDDDDMESDEDMDDIVDKSYTYFSTASEDDDNGVVSRPDAHVDESNQYYYYYAPSKRAHDGTGTKYATKQQDSRLSHKYPTSGRVTDADMFTYEKCRSAVQPSRGSGSGSGSDGIGQHSVPTSMSAAKPLSIKSSQLRDGFNLEGSPGSSPRSIGHPTRAFSPQNKKSTTHKHAPHPDEKERKRTGISLDDSESMLMRQEIQNEAAVARMRSRSEHHPNPTLQRDHTLTYDGESTDLGTGTSSRHKHGSRNSNHHHNKPNVAPGAAAVSGDVPRTDREKIAAAQGSGRSCFVAPSQENFDDSFWEISMDHIIGDDDLACLSISPSPNLF